MQVRCEHCHAGYTLPAERLTPGRRVQFACRHCGQRIVVQVPAAEAAPEVAPAPADEPRWFVAAADGSYRKLAESELAAAISTGDVGAQQLVWCKGFDEWLPAGEVPRWRPLFGDAGGASAPAPADRTVHQAQALHDDGDADEERRRQRRRTEVGLGDPTSELESQATEPAPAAAASAGQEVAPTEHSDVLAPGGDATRTDQPVVSVEEPEVASSIAGVGSSDASQAAVSLPIVRAQRPEPIARRADSGLHRARPRVAPRGGQEVAEGGETWAPGTDTYIGPRDNFTRRLGSGAERDALIAQVETAKAQRLELRRWQAVTVAACGVAFVALLLAAWAMFERRVAAEALKTCHTPSATQAAAAP